MAKSFSFICSCCGEVHEGVPGFSFGAPAPYSERSEEIRNAGQLSSDLCQFEDEDGPHFFIRVCLEIPIHGYEDLFIWGVWVSLSEENFHRYVLTYDSPDTNDCYFGWFCNYLPYYENTYAMKTEVHPRVCGTRPYIVLEQSNHPLSVDYHQGISFEKAKEISELILHRRPAQATDL